MQSPLWRALRRTRKRLRTVANGCERLRTVANGCGRLRTGGTHDIYSLLNYEGVLPREERHKAALRVMSWCTFRTPSSLRALLAALNAARAHPSTEDVDLVLLASRHEAPAHTPGELKAWLIGQLHCWVGDQHLHDYQGVAGTFLMDLALPITIYLLDYFLPQLNPTERCIDTLDIMAAPAHYDPQLMTFTFMREDPDFAYYAFTNTGGNVMVMAPKYADRCNNYTWTTYSITMASH